MKKCKFLPLLVLCYWFRTVLSGNIWMWLELEPEPKLWRKVEPDTKINYIGSETLLLGTFR